MAALFPIAVGQSTLSINDFSNDGTAHTILVTETQDNTYSIWTYGSDMTLVGLPTTGTSAVTFDNSLTNTYWAPKGFSPGAFGENQTWVGVMRTFLAFDFSPSGGPDAGIYASDVKFPSSGSRSPNYGPSSGHSTVVNHLFVDGTVHSIAKQIDPASYMFLIMRNGGDPFPPNIQ